MTLGYPRRLVECYKLRADGSEEPSLSSPSYISMVLGRDYSFKLGHTSSD